jgi:hypothetical protein
MKIRRIILYAAASLCLTFAAVLLFFDFVLPNTFQERFCANNSRHCVGLIKKRRGLGPNATTTTFVIFGVDGLFDFATLRENYIVFDPETFVTVNWIDETTLKIDYADGAYEIRGTIPVPLKVRFSKEGS